MHIAYVSQYCWPEISAPSFRIAEFGNVWRDEGHRVSVLTGFPNYPKGTVFPEYRGREPRRETHGGLEIVRVPHLTPGGGGMVRSAVAQLSTAGMVSLGAWRGLVGDPDVWIVTSPPLFMALAVPVLRRLVPGTVIFEVRDLWPDYFSDLGMLDDGPILRSLQVIERMAYRHADGIVPVTSGWLDRIGERGGRPTRIRSIPNGASLPEGGHERTNSSEVRSARRDLGLPQDGFVVGYVGTHGRCQRLHTLVPALSRESTGGFHFLFVGEGAKKDLLRERVTDAGIIDVTFLPNQPKDRVPDIYAACDVCLVPLGDFPTVSEAVPSKLFELMAHGVPVVGLLRGEGAEMIRAADAGLVVKPEDETGLSQALEHLASLDRQELRQMGLRGREYLRSNYTRSLLARRYLDFMAELREDALTTSTHEHAEGAFHGS